MIRVRFNPEELRLDVRGHAHSGAYGNDLVCAGASTLFYTLVESLYNAENMLQEKPYYKDAEGRGLVSCKPKPEYEGNIYLIYDTILNGFGVLQKNFPENIKILPIGVVRKKSDI